MHSLRKLSCVVAFALALVPVGLATPAQAEAPDRIAVGTQLVAVRDVQLHRAAILKGSTVSVTNLAQRQGQLESVDVELADGHVVPKVAAGTIRAAFRVVAP